MTLDDLFDALDLDADGALSRTDLHTAAIHMEWHWPEAPLYAVLDAFTVRAPLPRERFIEAMTQIFSDPHGPFGRVLLGSPLHGVLSSGDIPGAWFNTGGGSAPSSELPSLLRSVAGPEAAEDYEALEQRLGMPAEPIVPNRTALLVIDPQRSFTGGSWMRSIGPNGKREVAPIDQAFASCAHLLGQKRPAVETLFTRCPFPPDSYDWDERMARILDPGQLYFVKPGNSVLWPSTNGFRQWLDCLHQRGKDTLVMGGCTLNSCVRVSSIETQQLQRHRLQLVVDLSLCGARSGNYIRSSEFGGVSSVEAAVQEMVEAGVQVVPRLKW
jgi:nicotinamidase-related amidase